LVRCIEDLKIQFKEAKINKDDELKKKLKHDINCVKKEKKEATKALSFLNREQARIHSQKGRNNFEDNAFFTNLLINKEELCGIYRASYWDAYTGRDSRKWVQNFTKHLRVWNTQQCQNNATVQKWDKVIFNHVKSPFFF
jgi:hypothetical protein